MHTFQGRNERSVGRSVECVACKRVCDVLNGGKIVLNSVSFCHERMRMVLEVEDHRGGSQM